MAEAFEIGVTDNASFGWSYRVGRITGNGRYAVADQEIMSVSKWHTLTHHTISN